MSKVILPNEGSPIRMDGDKLNVPDNPIIPFIEGDGIGRDIWKSSQKVFDSAILKAYNGQKKIHWLEVYAGDKANDVYGPNTWLPDETIDIINKYLVAIKGPLTTPIGGGIRSINNTVYKVTLYELLKSYSGIKVQSLYQTINIPKLPVMTTQEGIKEIKNKMSEIDDWKKIQDLIPQTFKTSINFKKTGLASVFSASLELVKDGVVNLMQDNLFDDIYIRTAKHTPLKLKESKS